MQAINYSIWQQNDGIITITVALVTTCVTVTNFHDVEVI